MNTLRGLLDWVRELPAYQQVRDSLLQGAQETTWPDLPAAQAPVMAALAEDLQRPLLILTATADERRRLGQTLLQWGLSAQRLLNFPDPTALFYERLPWAPEVVQERLQVLTALFLYRMHPDQMPAPVIIASVRGVMTRTLPYRQLRKAALHIERGAQWSLTQLTRHALSIGYELVNVVEAPGQVSRRGGILDIYPPHAIAPYRLEFFGDEIDSLRQFDPATQRSGTSVSDVWILPVREALPRDGERAIAALQAYLQQPLPADVRLALEQDLRALEAGVPFPLLEFYLPYLYQEPGSLVQHLPADALVVLVREDHLAQEWAARCAQAEEQRIREMQEGPAVPAPYLPWETFQHQVQALPRLYLRPPEAEADEALPFLPEVHFAGRLEEALGRMRQWTGLGDQVVVVTRQAARLAELWQEFTPPPVLTELDQAPQTLITFVQGSLPGGWQINGGAVPRHLITDEELFGWRPPEPRRRIRRQVSAPETALAAFNPGDWVVHEDYGIGQYKGLVQRSVDDIEREYLLIEYANGDQLYVPIHQADRLTQYVAPEDFTPSPHRLGGTEWSEHKAQARAAAAEAARELLELYAARQVAQGHAFSPDTPWQAELEAAFPYTETEDQALAIAAVKADMERPVPMDRLICGDAGYGKTEVALRAAFKAVMDGKQVAMLVPTTILAQQHYQTFKERLAPFPVEVRLLSRFCTEAEQAETLKALVAGRVDIIIGTHRLLQKDVVFKDLGLVIIDEEQRFGVKHKERLKQMRVEVDVLTLTATPIPRTLYMALAGVRDVSIIETPPQERLPITTHIGPYDPELVQRAVQRELARGGQVFYVHNRVETIASVEQRLQRLLPEARIGVAHGQMPRLALAQVMQRFARGEIDVLLATTIIESGLDFPNANTLIVERAERFGLAQLYQLRGRVGRGTRRGYAYLFHGRRLSDEARQRLQALWQNESRGAGYAIALQDLELRGAGELLGTKQHGHIANVGFKLYTRMLAQEVTRLKQEQGQRQAPFEPLSAISIELPLAVGLPTSYIPDEALRLALYRRMAEITTEEQLDALAEELQDRFGPLPDPAHQLLYQLRVKLWAREARISAINVSAGQIALRGEWLKKLPAREWTVLRSRLEGARVGRQDIWIPLHWDPAQWKRTLQETLQRLSAWWAEMQVHGLTAPESNGA